MHRPIKSNEGRTAKVVSSRVNSPTVPPLGSEIVPLICNDTRQVCFYGDFHVCRSAPQCHLNLRGVVGTHIPHFQLEN